MAESTNRIQLGFLPGLTVICLQKAVVLIMSVIAWLHQLRSLHREPTQPTLFARKNFWQA